MNNPYCTGITFITFAGRNIRIEYDCNQLKIKIPYGKKLLILDRSENNCYVCTDRRIDDRGYSEIRFDNIWTNLFRFIYCLFNGKEDYLKNKKYIVIRHKCDNASCNNPAHLIEGTHVQNMQDMKDRERQCRGENHKNAVLNESIIRLILQSEMPVSYLSELYGVHENTVRKVKRREIWKHVQVEDDENIY